MIKNTHEALASAAKAFEYEIRLGQPEMLDGYLPSDPLALSVSGNALVRNGQKTALRGLSFAGWEKNWAKVEQHLATLYAENIPGLDVIRMPVQGNALSGVDLGTFIQTRMIPIVTDINDHGYDVIIDYHPIVDWDRESAMRVAETFWQAVAPVFRFNPRVLYELFNEPILPDATTLEAWGEYVKGMQPLVNLVRSKAPENIVIMGSPSWCTRLKFADQVQFSGKNIMYSFHVYPNVGASAPEGLSDWLKTQIPESVPLFITEFGFSTGAPNNPHTELSRNPQFKKEMERFFSERPHTCWTAWNYDDASIPAMLAINGAESKAWIKEILSVPVDFTPPAPKPDILALSELSGAVRCWEFRTAGGLVVDEQNKVSSLLSNTLTNAATQTVQTNRPLCVVDPWKNVGRFDGNDYLTAPTDPDFFSALNALTLVALVKFTSLDATDRRVVSIPGSGIEIFRKGTSGYVGAATRTRLGGSTQWLIPATKTPDNEWVAIFVMIDGETGRVSLRVGENIWMASKSAVTPSSVIGSPTGFVIGAQNGGTSGMKGDIEAVVVVDHIMRTDEMDQVFRYMQRIV